MTTYSCTNCGMGVAGLTCASCSNELVFVEVTKDDGSKVGVSECPNGCGKIKSPMCCGHEMHAS